MGAFLSKEDLVVRLLMNGNADDSSGNGNDFTINGSPSQVTDELGRSNQAYDFSDVGGDGFKNLTSNVVDLTSDYSILVKFAWTTNTSGTRQMVRLGNTSTAKSVSILKSSSQANKLWIACNGDSSSNSGDFGTFNNGWNDVMLSASGSTLNIYLNGVYKGNLTRYDIATNTSFVGYYNGSQSWNNAISEVLLYQRAVSEAEYQIWRLNSQLLEVV